MNIQIKKGLEGFNNDTGIVVIIDVIRACTTIPILFKNGTKEIIPVKNHEDAIHYKSSGYMLIGEGIEGVTDEIYDFNNSPSEILNSDYSGKNVVLRSNNATQAVFNATSASDLIMASFVNLSAVVKYIKKLSKDVTLVALGSERGNGLEDDLCAQVIKQELLNKPYDFNKIKDNVYKSETAQLVINKLKKPEDVDIALKINSCNIVPLVFTQKKQIVIRAL